MWDWVYDAALSEKLEAQFKKRIQTNLVYLDNDSYLSDTFEKLANKLSNFLDPSLSNIQFVNSGSEGIELALKLVVGASHAADFKICSFRDSYHGNFLGGLSISGLDAIQSNKNEMSFHNVEYFKFPSNRAEENEVIASVEKEGDSLSAFVIEPVLASGGVRFASRYFWNKFLATLHRHGVIIIFDEVATGFWRTGSPFYHSNLQTLPDILVMSKQINNGFLPFGAVAWNDAIDQQLIKNPIEHFSTENGNLLCADSGLITLEYFIENSKTLSKSVAQLNHFMVDTAIQNGIQSRTIGGMQALILPNEVMTFTMLNRLVDFGFLTYPFINHKDTGISIMPPFNAINNQNFRRKLSAFYKVFSRLSGTY